MSSTLKLMSYNIHYGTDTFNKLNLERIADAIRAADPDIAGLQEVDKHWSDRSAFMDLGRALAETLGMQIVFAPNLDRDPLAAGEPRRQYGTAVLSKHPIVRSSNHALSSFGKEQRGMLETEIAVGARYLMFYNIHMGLTSEQRVKQAEEVLDIMKGSTLPLVLLGDFNAHPDSEEIEQFKRSGLIDSFSGIADAGTFPSITPARRIDYIFYNDQLELVEREVVASDASDHRPIVGIYRFKS
ncbi:hypothetical protein PAESOLCIP111_03405 [Paenibacillus solanacearum]|uniref:Endonuclease/exonuclease/phosphatase domain-containing protein n=1 Tax=Paenibacillus solanacearum TaxID=2048548 RepID=A0A916NJT9_9BACL|nr:endonuclease/exonuclease/phosphatase family protein [Paenibacillus solanacearum]CAG7632692.1 hypothetical protein PAESOLCIP111_03405 [Paenibacillus solanacearum]